MIAVYTIFLILIVIAIILIIVGHNWAVNSIHYAGKDEGYITEDQEDYTIQSINELNGIIKEQEKRENENR